MRLVYGVGINDCRGWSNKEKRPKEDLEYRIYNLWHHMMMRGYSEVCKRKSPCYIGVTVCERWHRLSNFAEDIKTLPNYELWKNNPRKNICLDKDIRIKGNKEYRPEACMFITLQESGHDVCTRMQHVLKAPEALEKLIAPKRKPVICTYPNGTEELFQSASAAGRRPPFSTGLVAACARGERKTHHGCKFRYA